MFTHDVFSDILLFTMQQYISNNDDCLMTNLQTVESSLDSWSIRKFFLEPEKALSVALKNRDILLKLTEEVKFRAVPRFLQFSIIYLLEQAYRLMAAVLLHQGKDEEACDCMKASEYLNAKYMLVPV